MTNKYLLILLWLFAVCSVSGQTAEYRKINLSVHAGMDFPIGTSNTAGLDPDFMLPFLKGFSATFDGAYYFTKNFGVGLKYHFYIVNDKGGQFFPPDKGLDYSFKEMTHYIGPAFFGKWMLGTSNWEVLSNAGIGYVHNKIFDHIERGAYKVTGGGGLLGPDKQPFSYSCNDQKSNSVGLMLSAGIRYRITPAISIGINASGMFSGAKNKNSKIILVNRLPWIIPGK